MGNNSNAIKSKQLGMDYGTATSRLRKMVLLNLLQRLGDDFCFQCGERIETVEDLTLEHKVPWLHGSNALFWDVNNVAFSHRSCNSSAARITPERRKGNPTSGRCNSKFSAEEVRYIRKSAKEGVPVRVLAREFGVHHKTIQHMVGRKTWKNIK